MVQPVIPSYLALLHYFVVSQECNMLQHSVICPLDLTVCKISWMENYIACTYVSHVSQYSRLKINCNVNGLEIASEPTWEALVVQNFPAGKACHQRPLITSVLCEKVLRNAVCTCAHVSAHVSVTRLQTLLLGTFVHAIEYTQCMALCRTHWS